MTIAFVVWIPGCESGFIFASCVTSEKLLNFSVPHKLHLQNEGYRTDVRIKAS